MGRIHCLISLFGGEVTDLKVTAFSPIPDAINTACLLNDQ